MTTTKTKVSGVITALVTPFKGGEIDKKSFVRLLQHQLEQGIRGFVINGTTGESTTLALNEVRELYDIARFETGKKATLLIGTGANSTAKTAALSREVSAWGPSALLVVVPYYNRPPQRGLIQHFTAVAKASAVPIMLYDVPSRTVAALDAATSGELSRVGNIIGIKDATGKMSQLDELKRTCERDFSLLSGDDATAVEFCANGGVGVISVCSHLIGRELIELLAAGPEAAAQFREKYADLMKWLYCEANPIPVKMALHWMGIIDSPELRLPLMSLHEQFHKDFKTCLSRLKKI